MSLVRMTVQEYGINQQVLVQRILNNIFCFSEEVDAKTRNWMGSPEFSVLFSFSFLIWPLQISVIQCVICSGNRLFRESVSLKTEFKYIFQMVKINRQNSRFSVHLLEIQIIRILILVTDCGWDKGQKHKLIVETTSNRQLTIF